MKTKILIGALSCALLSTANAENAVENKERDVLVKKTSWIDEEAMKKVTEMSLSDEYLNDIIQKQNEREEKRKNRNPEKVKKEINEIDFTKIDMNSDHARYIEDFDFLTEKNQEIYINWWLDRNNRVSRYPEMPKIKDRFDRSIIEPKFSEPQIEKRELFLEKLLDECIHIIGKEERDNIEYLTLKRASYVLLNFQIPAPNFIFFLRIQENYLGPRLSKCVHYLYGNNKGQLQPSDLYYDMSDFEYNQLKDPKYIELENKYSLIYLHVREAGLLRRMFDAFYPKSLLREYATQTGLTEFIKKQELQAGKPLKHDELAEQFFGSTDAWLKGLNKFFDDKILKFNISEKFNE